MPDDIQKVIESKQETNTGIEVSSSGIVTNEFDEVSWETLRKDYDNMMKDTPAIKSSVNMIVYPMLAAKRRIDVGESESEIAKEARDYIDYCWENVKGGFANNLKHNAQAITQGLQIHEKIIKKGDDYKFLKDNKFKKKLTNRIIKYAPIQNETIHEFKYNEIGDFVGIIHMKKTPNIEGGFKIEYPKLYEGENGIKNVNDIFSVYTYDELYNDIRGNSILRPARLYWTCLKKVIIGRAVNIQRGSGVVLGKYASKPSDADTKKFEAMAKALNSLNGDNFVWYDGSGLEVILSELKGQQEVMAFIDFLYKQILMTLLTEFISIGMGQVGAYNAGETQKSPYEMTINYQLEDFKRFYQKETEYMIDISYLSGLSKEDMPRFEFDAPNQIDLIKTTQIILNMKNAGMPFTVEDYAKIKELLPFLPEQVINITDQQTLQPEGEENVKENVEEGLSAKIFKNIDNYNIKEKEYLTSLGLLEGGKIDLNVKNSDYLFFKKDNIRMIKPDILEFESSTFDKTDIEEHYLSIEDKANSIILKAIKDILKDLKGQYKQGAQRSHIDNWYSKELEAKLLELFETGYNKGQGDVKKEIKKVQTYKKLKIKNEALELALDEKKQIKQSKILSISISNLLNRIKNKVDYDITSMSEKKLNAVGGVDGYFSGLEEEFKVPTRDIINDTTAGYTTGRNDKLNEVSTDDTEFLYSAIMDKNLCNHCSQWDGLTFTKSEIESSKNFTLNGNSVNLDCLGLKGRNQCRCQFIIYS